MTDPGAIVVRSAIPADAERIAELFTDEGYPVGPTDVVGRLARFADRSSIVLVATSGDEILGFLAAHLVPRFETDAPFARIVALVVDAGVRERGVGHVLMEAAERRARDDGAAFIEVTAGYHRPDARRLYEALGYDGTVTAYLRKRL